VAGQAILVQGGGVLDDLLSLEAKEADWSHPVAFDEYLEIVSDQPQMVVLGWYPKVALGNVHLPVLFAQYSLLLTASLLVALCSTSRQE
jgi:hypothetical protein